jgi:glycosyltransferase involved in cell wall biosynthesis
MTSGMLPTETAEADPDSGSRSVPLVSVMVACFNHETYVRECMDSILATGYPNLELVIVDDASTDGSDRVITGWLEEHATLKARYLPHTINIGLIRSLNQAIMLVTGDYFCPIAADDAMLPNGIIDRVRYLQAKPGKLAVFGDSRVIDASGRTIFASGIEGLLGPIGMRRRHLTIDRLIPYCVVFTWAVPGPVFLCRRSAFQVVGLYDEELVVEDWDMYLRLAAIGALGFVDAVVSEYRVHDTNLTRLYPPAMRDDMMKTAGKNARRYRGLKRAYLRATAQQGRATGRRWKVQSRIELALMRRAYRMIRRLVTLGAHRSGHEPTNRHR